MIAMEPYMHRLGITKLMAGIPNDDIHLKDKTIRILQVIEGMKEADVGLCSQFACERLRIVVMPYYTSGSCKENLNFHDDNINSQGSMTRL